jgi:signal transduction histidine kinase
VDLDWLNRFSARRDLPAGAHLVVVARDGDLLLRYPDPDKQWLTQTVTDLPGLKGLLLRGHQGKGRGRTAEGEEHLYAFAPLSRTGGLAEAWVVVDIPAQEVQVTARRQLTQNLSFLGAVAVFALSVALFGGNLFVLRHVKTLVRATEELGRGDLKVRIGAQHGPGEFGQLAQAFDTMADSLEQRMAELRRTQAELKQLNQELEQRVTGRTQELKRSNEELEQFAYVASHDLQEPLRMVTNYMQLLKQRHGDKLDTSAHEFMAFALDGAVRMQGMITDLLAYSRVGTQRRPFEDIDLELVLARALNNLKVAWDESGAVITHDPLPAVLGDAVQLTQLLQNLIANALKFRSPQSPTVHISVQPAPRPAVSPPGDPGEWQFAVRDNGIGIAPEHHERIFIIFQRLHPRGQYAGSGIGLAVCKKIVERHGGRIWLESQPGQGTTFFFTLPGVGDRRGAA